MDLKNLVNSKFKWIINEKALGFFQIILSKFMHNHEPQSLGAVELCNSAKKLYIRKKEKLFHNNAFRRWFSTYYSYHCENEEKN